MLTADQVAKLKAKREAEQAAAAAKTSAPPSPPPQASRAATAPTAPAPTPAAPLNFAELHEGTLRTLEGIIDQLGAQAVPVTPDIPFAALTLAAMMLTDGEGFGHIPREHFARLALQAYDRAVLVPAGERGK